MFFDQKYLGQICKELLRHIDRSKLMLTVCGVGGEDDDVGGGAVDGVPQGRRAVGRFVRDAVAAQVGLEGLGFSLVSKYHTINRS
jgi:hypothetical protein